MLGDALQWVSCDGGPHVLLPRTAFGLWNRQRNGPSRISKGFPSDYCEACKIALAHDVGVIAVAGSFGLVIGGDDVPMSTWIPETRNGGGTIVVAQEWQSNSSDLEIVEAIHRLPTTALRQDRVFITVSERDFVLFAASDFPQRLLYSTLSFEMRPGEYEVASGQCLDANDTLLRVHRLGPGQKRCQEPIRR